MMAGALELRLQFDYHSGIQITCFRPRTAEKVHRMSRSRRKQNDQHRTEIVVALIGAAAIILAALIALLPLLAARDTPAPAGASPTVAAALPATSPAPVGTQRLANEGESGDAGSCLTGYTADITSEQQVTVEAGTGGRDLMTPAAWLNGGEPVGPLAAHLTHGGEPIGIVKFLLLHDDADFIGFSVLSAMNESCQEVTDLDNTLRSGSGLPVALQNWDTLRIPLVMGDYFLRFGWQGDRIRLSLRSSS